MSIALRRELYGRQPGTCAMAVVFGMSFSHRVNCSLAVVPLVVPIPGSSLVALRPAFFWPMLYIVFWVVPAPTNPTSPRSTPAICPSSQVHSPAISFSRSSRHAVGLRPSRSKPGSEIMAPAWNDTSSAHTEPHRWQKTVLRYLELTSLAGLTPAIRSDVSRL